MALELWLKAKAVSFPVMPKGVEHFLRYIRNSLRVEVSFPVMPKGVEHTGVRRCSRSATSVSFPVMPKGVEHRSNLSAVLYLER